MWRGPHPERMTMSHEQIIAAIRADHAELERTLNRSAASNIGGVLVSAALGAAVALGAAFVAFKLFY